MADEIEDFATNLGLLPLLEELILPLLPSLALLSYKVPPAGHLFYSLLVNAFQVDLGTRGNDVSRVHSPERHTVDFKWACDKKDTLWKVLKENDALAAETASEENENGSRLQGRSMFGWVGGFADLCTT